MELGYKVNQKVQAVDELGRWENAVVTGIAETGWEVRFPGYERDCDRLVPRDEIRERVPPFEEQQRKGYEKKPTEESEAAPVKRRLTMERAVPKAKKVCREPPVNGNQPEQGIQQLLQDTAVASLDGAVVGKVFQIKGTNAAILVTALNIESHRAECVLVGEEGVDLESQLKLPTSRLEACKVRLGRSDQRLADEFMRKSMEATMHNMEHPQYRRLYRTSVLSTLLRGEVNSALRSRIGVSSVSLGPSVPDVDFQLLGLNPPENESIFSHQRNNWLAKHRAAVTLQRMWRGFLTRRRLRLGGFVLHSSNLEQRTQVIMAAHQELDHQSLLQQPAMIPLPLVGKQFVLAGNIPKFKNKKTTRNDICKMISENGGRVRSGFPGRTKGRSTKKYVLLYNPNAKGKPPAAIKEAIRHGYPVVSYEYVYDCILHSQNHPTAGYEVKFPQLTCKVTREPSVQRHFRQKRSFISLVKGPREKRSIRKNAAKLVNTKNPAVVYASESLALSAKREKFSFLQCGQMYKSFLQRFKNLSCSLQNHYRQKWHRLKQQRDLQLQTVAELTSYNCKNPISGYMLLAQQ